MGSFIVTFVTLGLQSIPTINTGKDASTIIRIFFLIKLSEMKYYEEEFWQVVEAFVELSVILLAESVICGRDIRDVEL